MDRSVLGDDAEDPGQRAAGGPGAAGEGDQEFVLAVDHGGDLDAIQPSGQVVAWPAGTGRDPGCLASAAYGFLSGAWPFGVVEAIWSLIAVGRYLAGRLGG
jgi:hypothetical protein